MADQFSNEGSSMSNRSGEASDETIELNIKTLDSQNYSFQVDKNMLVSAFKEKISNEIGVPVGQQRLIFRGKVLKDDHLLSEYQVDNGHTLHLVARQPTQPQSSADTSSGDTNANGNNTTSGSPQNRIGQLSHSVVLGTFNVGDSGEGTVPDLSRVIGAVLNSFGIGGQIGPNGIGGMQSSTMPNISSQTAQGNESEGVSRSSGDGQNQAENQTPSGPAFPQVVQIPVTAAVPLPSLHLPIPDSLSTLSVFMTLMEQTLAQNGYQPNTSSNSSGDLPSFDLPANSQGVLPLSIVLRHAEWLLSGRAVAALSHIAGRLERDGASSDPSMRGQIQTESVQVGLAMQHLGALFLELGRTILTLRMGQSPAEASVNPGPAVYISPSGPNPIMVQPSPLQTHSLFSGSAAQSNPLTFGPVGIGNAPRNINIHITAGTSLAPVVSTIGTRGSNGEALQGERGNGTSSGPVRVLPVRNITAATMPAHSTGIAAVSNAAQPGPSVSVSQPLSDSTSLSSVISEVSSRLRSIVGSMQGENQPTSGSFSSGAGNETCTERPNSSMFNGAGESTVTVPQSMPEGDKKEQDDIQGSNDEAKESLLSSKVQSCSVECSSRESSIKSEKTSESSASSSDKHDIPEAAQAVPLGLGMGTLDKKRRTKQPKSLVKSGDDGTNNNHVSQNLLAGTSGQQLLQSLASCGPNTSRMGANDTQTGQLPPSGGRNPESRPLGQQGSDAQIDTASVMSQVINSPALNGLLSGVSEQTGIGSPNILRNMLQQLTQSPQIMGTVSQIAQQVERQDLGGIDLSRMMQQMMPVVSQVLGQGSPAQPFPRVESESQMQYNESALSGNGNPNGQNVQIDLQDVAQRIGHYNAPGDVFRTVAENAARLNGNESRYRGIVDELSNNEDLVSEYLEMLQGDLDERLQRSE